MSVKSVIYEVNISYQEVGSYKSEFISEVFKGTAIIFLSVRLAEGLQIW